MVWIESLETERGGDGRLVVVVGCGGFFATKAGICALKARVEGEDMSFYEPSWLVV